MLINLKAIITGASRGIGREIALKFARKGINLLVTGRDENALKNLIEEIRPYDIKSEMLVGDLAQADEPEKIVRLAVESLGGIDILVNNAGFAIQKLMEDTLPAEWDRLLNVNARAPYFLCKYAIRYLKESDRASIINISSVVGRKGYPSQSAYGASKHALVGFTKAMAKEIQKYGIRVHLIAPGGVNTRLVKDVRPDLDIKELIEPTEIANLVYFLIENRDNAMIDEINVARASNIPWL